MSSTTTDIESPLPRSQWFKQRGTLPMSMEELKWHLIRQDSGSAIEGIRHAPTENPGTYQADTQGGNAGQQRRRETLRQNDIKLAAIALPIIQSSVYSHVLTRPHVRESAKELLFQLDTIGHEPEYARAIFDYSVKSLEKADFPNSGDDRATRYKTWFIKRYQGTVEISNWQIPLLNGQQLLQDDMAPTNTIVRWIQKTVSHVPMFQQAGVLASVNKAFRLLNERQPPYNNLGGPLATITAALDILVATEKDAPKGVHAEDEADQLYSAMTTTGRQSTFHRQPTNRNEPQRDGRTNQRDRRRGNGKGRMTRDGQTKTNGDAHTRNRKHDRISKFKEKRMASTSSVLCHAKYERLCRYGSRCHFQHLVERRGDVQPPPPRSAKCAICFKEHETHRCNFLKRSKDHLSNHTGQLQGQVHSLQRDNVMMSAALARKEDHDFTPLGYVESKSLPKPHISQRHPVTQTKTDTFNRLSRGFGAGQVNTGGTPIGGNAPDASLQHPYPSVRQLVFSLDQNTDLEGTLASTTLSQRRHELILDSGATSTYTTNKSLLFNYNPITRNEETVVDAGGKQHLVQGRGQLKIAGAEQDREITVENVGYTPTLRVSLLSASQLRRQGCDITCPHDSPSWITPPQRGGTTAPRITAIQRNGLEWLAAMRPTEHSHRAYANPLMTMLQKRSPNVRNKKGPPQQMQKEKDVPTLLKELKGSTSDQHRTSIRARLAELKTYTTANIASDLFLKFHDSTGHRNPETTAMLARQYGIALPRCAQIFCHACAKSKSKRKPRSKKPKHKLTLPIMYSAQIDIYGPLAPSKVDRFTYMLAAVCRSTRTNCVYGMHDLTEVRQTLERHFAACKQLQTGAEAEWEANSEKLPSKSVTTSFGTFHPRQGQMHIQSDSHSVFVSKAAQALFRKHGYTHTQSPSYSQNKNALVERFFGSIGNTSRTMLAARDLSEDWWWWATRHAAMLYDITPHTGLGNISPYESRNGHRAPSIGHLLHPIGAIAYVHNNARNSKAEDRANRGQYIGHHTPSGSNLILSHATGRILKSIDVTFDTTLPTNVLTGVLKLNQEEDPRQRYEDWQSDDEDAEETDAHIPAEAPSDPVQHHPDATIDNAVVVQHMGEPVLDMGWVNVVTSTKNVSVPGESTAHKTQAPPETQGSTEFRSLSAALKSEHGKPFQAASDKEWSQLYDMGVVHKIWKSEISNEQYVHRSSQIFKIKFDEKGQPKRWKARTVLDGRTLIQGCDHSATESPCPTQTTIRMVIADAANQGHKLFSFDVPGAYLTTTREKVCYAHFPFDQQQWRTNPKTGKRDVQILKVTGNLYGAPDGGRRFYLHFCSILEKLGFTKSRLDPCLFYRGKNDTKITMVCHVDDGLYHAGSEGAAAKFAQELNDIFGDVGAEPAKHYLGQNIIQNKDPTKGIYVTHQTMIEANHKRFAIPTKPTNTPLPTDTKISKGDQLTEDQVPIQYPYRSINGYTSYVAICTRPDAAFATSQLSRVQGRPAQKHADLCTRTANYLYHTRQRGVHYKFKSGTKLVSYSDASWQDIPSHCTCAQCLGEKPTKPNPTSTTKQKGTTSTCHSCKQKFQSRRQLFDHLGSSLTTKQECPATKIDKRDHTLTSEPKRRRTNPEETSPAPNDSRASSFGGIITIGSSPIWWKSTVSKNKPTSTHESELSAAFHVARVVLHVRWLAAEMGMLQTNPTNLYVDNQGVIQTCLRIAVPSKSRHIERQFFNLRDWVSDVQTLDICTHENPADIFTKPLAKAQFNKLCNTFMATAPDVHKC